MSIVPVFLLREFLSLPAPPSSQTYSCAFFFYGKTFAKSSGICHDDLSMGYPDFILSILQRDYTFYLPCSVPSCVALHVDNKNLFPTELKPIKWKYSVCHVYHRQHISQQFIQTYFSSLETLKLPLELRTVCWFRASQMSMSSSPCSSRRLHGVQRETNRVVPLPV